ncbi:VOC family protein [Vibrio parahaemolyticus]
MILNHVSVGASDVVKAIGFYDSVLSTLSIKRAHYIENIAAAYGENFEFWVGSPCEGKATSSNGAHIAFNAPSKEAVDQFYASAIELGGCSFEYAYNKQFKRDSQRSAFLRLLQI